MCGTFDWTYSGLNSSHFHALANLLSLRNGGQAEPSSFSELVLDEDWDPDDDGHGNASSVDTELAHQISGSGHGRLKRRFLDCLADFAANKKGGTAVACSAMKEAEDNVVIWVARNQGFSDADKLTFDNMGKLLGSSFCNNGTSYMWAWSLHTKLALVVQPINLRLIFGKRWSRIIRTESNKVISLI